MEAKALQKDLFVKIAILTGILLVIGGGVFYLEKTIDDISQKKDWLRNEVNTIKDQLDGLNKKTLEFSEAVKTWESLPSGKKELQGLRINKAKDILDGYKIKYKLPVLETAFSKPTEEKLNDSRDSSETIIVISSNVSIQFEGLTDQYIIGFIQELMKDFPGYIQVTNLVITRAGEPTKEILRKISLGEMPGLIKGKIEFIWRDLKYRPVNTVKKEDK